MLAFVNCFLLDGAGNPPIKGATVLINNERIVSAGLDIQIPSDAHIIDVGGRTVMPGIVDVHVHMGGSDKFDGDLLVGIEKSDTYSTARRRLLMAGVTSVRSGGDFEADILRLRDMADADEITSPRLFVCGKAIQPVGGHPAYTVWQNETDILANAIATPETDDEIRVEVRRQAELGANHIKLFLADDNYMAPGEKTPRLSGAMMRAAAEEAHSHAMKVMVHCQEPLFALEALEAGADSVEHLFCGGHELDPLPDGIAEAFKKNGAFLVPTLASAAAMKTHADKLSAIYRSIKLLFDEGVKIAVGTDFGTPLVDMDRAAHIEMAMLAGAGIPPVKVIEAATSRGAELLGSREFGTIAPGKLADILVVDGDPLVDMACTWDIHTVVKNGKILTK